MKHRRPTPDGSQLRPSLFLKYRTEIHPRQVVFLPFWAFALRPPPYASTYAAICLNPSDAHPIITIAADATRKTATPCPGALDRETVAVIFIAISYL